MKIIGANIIVWMGMISVCFSDGMLENSISAEAKSRLINVLERCGDGISEDAGREALKVAERMAQVVELLPVDVHGGGMKEWLLVSIVQLAENRAVPLLTDDEQRESLLAGLEQQSRFLKELDKMSSERLLARKAQLAAADAEFNLNFSADLIRRLSLPRKISVILNIDSSQDSWIGGVAALQKNIAQRTAWAYPVEGKARAKAAELESYILTLALAREIEGMIENKVHNIEIASQNIFSGIFHPNQHLHINPLPFDAVSEQAEELWKSVASVIGDDAIEIQMQRLSEYINKVYNLRWGVNEVMRKKYPGRGGVTFANAHEIWNLIIRLQCQTKKLESSD